MLDVPEDITLFRITESFRQFCTLVSLAKINFFDPPVQILIFAPP